MVLCFQHALDSAEVTLAQRVTHGRGVVITGRLVNLFTSFFVASQFIVGVLAHDGMHEVSPTARFQFQQEVGQQLIHQLWIDR